MKHRPSTRNSALNFRTVFSASLLASAALMLSNAFFAPLASAAGGRLLVLNSPRVSTAQVTTNGMVLILDTTVSGGTASREAQAAMAAGKGVQVVDSTQWLSMTTADFAAYDAIILGDPTCGDETIATVPATNANVWGAAINGNLVIVGTDPTYHATFGNNAAGAQQLITSAVAFAGAASGKTGAYIALSCYYHNTLPNTPVPLLDGLSTPGSFTVTGVGCYNDSHIVASSAALTGLADADLSNWSCSVHEAFDHRPADFIPLAIARDPAGGSALPGSEAFPDGTSGVPYILARGEIAPVGFVLTPFTATNNVGTPHTVTATIERGGSPVVGVTVTFTVTGVNSTTGSNASDTNGVARFTYIGTNAGTDTIVATYNDTTGHTFTSNTVEKIWEGGGGPSASGNIIGLESASVGAQKAVIDSFDSNAGPYGSGNSGSQVTLLSNGLININGAKIFGNALSAQDDIFLKPGSHVTGDVTAGKSITNKGGIVDGMITPESPTPLIVAPPVPDCDSFSGRAGITGRGFSYNPKTGDLMVRAAGTVMLDQGSYCFHSITLSGKATLQVNGPVTITLSGLLNLSGGSTANPSSAPANLQISSSYAGDNGVVLGGGSSGYMSLYAPQTNVTLSGGAQLFGSLIGKTLTMTGESAVHADTRLGPFAAP